MSQQESGLTTKTPTALSLCITSFHRWPIVKKLIGTFCFWDCAQQSNICQARQQGTYKRFTQTTSRAHFCGKIFKIARIQSF